MPAAEMTMTADEKEPDKAPVVNGTETLPRQTGKQVNKTVYKCIAYLCSLEQVLRASQGVEGIDFQVL